VQSAIKVALLRLDCSDIYGSVNYGIYKYDVSATKLGCRSSTNKARLS